MTLLVCSTCPRYDRHRSGRFGRAIKQAVTEDPRDVPIRSVACLGGCPHDGVVALDGPGLSRVRFTHLGPADAPAVITAALAHAHSGTGDPTDWEVPAQIADRLSAVTVKRGPIGTSTL
jgi:predicted metal-binding protein